MANDPHEPSQPSQPDSSGGGEASSSPADSESSSGFDAVKAAEELAASLGMSSAGPAVGEEAYIATIEREVEELNLLIEQRDLNLAQRDAELAKAKAALATAEAAHDDEIERATGRIQKEEAKRAAVKRRKLLLEFLEILDDMDRAIDSFERGGTPDAIIDGIELIRGTFMRKLGEFGVSHLPAMGTDFDPNVHEGVSLMPVTEADQSGKVVAVVREGYMVGDECLRPARVAVGKKDAG